MMIPASSLQTRSLYATSTPGSVANPAALSTAGATSQPAQADQATTSDSSNLMATMMPLMMQLMQVMVVMMQQIFGQGATNNANSNGTGAVPGADASNGSGGATGSNGAGAVSVNDTSGGTTTTPGTGGYTGGSNDTGTVPGNDTSGGTTTTPGTDGSTGGSNDSGNQDTGNSLVGQTLPGGTQQAGQVATESVNQIRNLNYSSLSEAQRVQFNGVSRDSAAIIHLGGRANISGAVTANGVSPAAQIYNNVLQDPTHFHPEEVALVKKWSQQEMATRGMITGENLDHAFIAEMGTRDGVNQQQLQQYHTAVDQRVSKMLANPNRAAVLADTKKPLNLVDDIGTLQKQSGLNKTEQAAFRLAGHAVLFSGNGSVNGDILALTQGNVNALDNRGANNGSIDAETKALTDADMADNGKLDGSSLRAADGAVLNKLYGGGQGIANNQQIVNQAKQAGLSQGRTMKDIQQSILNGGKQALNDFKQLAKDHSPAMLAAGATMAGAAAVCPFLGGMAAGAAGIGAAQKLMNQGK